MNSSIKNKLLIGLILGLLIYAAIAFFADLEKLLEIGRQFPWLLFPVIMVLAFSNYLIRFIRWHIYLKNLSIELPFKHSAIVFFSGLAMSVSPGKFGELLKAQYIKNMNDTPRRKTGAVIIAERLTDLIGVLFLASFGVFRFNYGLVLFLVVLGLLLFALVMLSTRKLAIWFIKLFSGVPIIGPRVPKLIEAYDSVSALLRPGRLVLATALSMLAWAAEGWGFYLVINALPGVNVSLQMAFFIYAFAILIGAVSMLPGGLGVTEGTMAGLLVLLNMSRAKAIGATLITRLATIWFAVLIGTLCTAIWYKLLEFNPNAD